MSEKHDKSCASQQQKEKKQIILGLSIVKKHIKKTDIKINLKTLCFKYIQDQSSYEKYNLGLTTKII
ncbi:hypothetical protein [Clostridium botulinum]|uniref:Uncharacterized protein n=1 Tax=Clostridium botulinum (strain Kyoto / Type A2) TaxID=536232 RepID=C1FNY7_CLOBJ|nr:hypothetical protein [Clostridium botulinum]ACO84198.1 conserved hypothetical protein [Clostridium botulinum A2 str. Kyoto]APC82012.1 hypothetical protein NPD2_279 [Clostridium botulinum]APC85843.1 hypothetical protein NPD12_1998 [Clostridium botulinum]APH22793.1 hypothetical protein NPD1_3260 [Clostridium botulinum]APQ68890.1 hypothetical protein RSJ8_1386 [Clostridium botulinum]